MEVHADRRLPKIRDQELMAKEEQEDREIAIKGRLARLAAHPIQWLTRARLVLLGHEEQGCLPKPAKSNGFLWITFSLEHNSLGRYSPELSQ